MKILVTGTAGFIGYYLVEKLASLDHYVIGIDNINNYYDINLKYARLQRSGIKTDKIEYGIKIQSTALPTYSFVKLDLTDRESLFALFAKEQFDCICNLAAQAGVRYSLENPYSYIDSNIQGFINILEAARQFNIRHLVYASSSSVYGINKKVPFSESDKADCPASLYAASKKANELMAYSYANLYKIPCSGLRFFTVYGPLGRPDMAYFLFTNAITEGKSIDVYNNGDMLRDFTYIDDIVDGITKAIERPPKTSDSLIPYKLYNLGNNNPVKLLDFIEVLEKHLGKRANKNFLPMQPGDVPVTMADIEFTKQELSWQPKTSIEEGLKKFVVWYKSMEKI